MSPQPLSTVLNAAVISSVLSADQSHQSIFDTLLESRVTGVDSEIRTEYVNGVPTRFPVLILCLDGLERLLGKHEKAKELLEKKIKAEVGQPAVDGVLVQSFPIARTGALRYGNNGEEIEALKKRLEDEYAEKKQKLDADTSAELAKLKQKLESESAEELSQSKLQLEEQRDNDIAKFKERLRDDALEEQTRLIQHWRSENADEYAKLKDGIQKNKDQELTKEREELRNEAANDLDELKRQLRAKNLEGLTALQQNLYNDATRDLRTLRTELREEAAGELSRIREEMSHMATKMVQTRLSEHNKQYQKRMELNSKTFVKLLSKHYVDVTLEGENTRSMTDQVAVRFLARNPRVFQKYRGLCVEALKKYKKELKEQHQNHLDDIESECRAWLKQHAGGGLRVEVMQGIRDAIAKGRACNPEVVNIQEDVGLLVTREVLKEEVKEIMADFAAQQQKSIFDGGLRLPPFEAKAEIMEPATQEANTAEDTAMLVVLDDGLDNMDGTFLGTPLKNLRTKARQLNRTQNVTRATGTLSRNETVALSLSGAELRERRANIEQSFQWQNVSCTPNIVSASSYYAAKENIPMSSSTNQNQVVNMACQDEMQARMEPEATGSRTAGQKDTTGKKDITEGKDSSDNDDVQFIMMVDILQRGMPNGGQQPVMKSNAASTLVQDRKTGNRDEGEETMHAHPRNDRPAMQMEVDEEMIPQSVRESLHKLTAKELLCVKAAKDVAKLANIEARLDTFQTEPLASRSFTSKQELFETLYAGMTVNEIYQSLCDGKGAQRKRHSEGSASSEDMPLRKKINQERRNLKE